MKAMILAAGLGSRLRPLTDHRPKALVELKGKSLLELNIHRLKKAGFHEIIINVHHHAEQIMEFVKKNHFFGIHIEFSIEDQLLNTGGGVKKAAWFFQDVDYFLVQNVDVLTDLAYLPLFKKLQTSDALACLAVRSRATHRYLLFDSHFQLCGWQNIKTNEIRLPLNNKIDLKPYSFLGIQVLSNKIFNYFPSQPAFSLIEAYLQMVKQKQKIVGHLNQQARWIDVGKLESLKQAEQLFSDWLNE